ncbi:MAG: hypothetical protein ABIQ04_04505 [Candidatus Saccharimonadales bacterium]
MKRIQTIIISLVAVVGIGTTGIVLSPQMSYAAPGDIAQKPADVAADKAAAADSPTDQITKGVTNVGPSNTGTLDGGIKNTINVLLYIIGIAAVIMIVIGGLRYVLSGGDSSATKGAKDTILYAVVGLVIAIIAFAIVNFVVTSFKP